MLAPCRCGHPGLGCDCWEERRAEADRAEQRPILSYPRRSTVHLEAGMTVVTSEVDGADFDIPLVSPTTRMTRNRTTRTVRSVVRGSGGQVVRFTDGTKTRPLNGRTTWLVK